ncbi:MAG TPA: NADH-quinone oxidoreductase subunit J, partial [Candidatus Nitrosotenuis sp.]|nr:NADH-quinone oxidoreductase subunit J [Candidatus Nitrosotenuis sp.]
AIGVIAGRNPVHAVLFLILTFLNGAGLFLLAQAELLALLLVIVYVGAVAVLFLFVVMMLDINFKELRKGVNRHAPMAIIVGGIFAIELILVAKFWNVSPSTPYPTGFNGSLTAPTNGHAIGRLLYTDYFLLFQLAGAILLVAMIGAIVLTFRHRREIKNQDTRKQIQRQISDTLEIHQVKPRTGIKL